MKVARIGHASLVISTARMRVIMDPILIDPFDSRSTVFDPPVRIDAGVLTGVDLVVLSHQHMDHFCVESLNAIERHRPVVYPREATLIADALRRLGFHHPVPVDHAEVIDIGGLRLCGVMNPVDRTEMGFVFAAEGHVVWNQVDTWYDHSTYRQLAPLIGPVDLLIAPYQPMVELPLSEGPLGTDFPYQDYARLLGNVLAVAPRFVVPGSCGSSFVGGRWLDSRCFGATEPQFLADLARLSPGLRGASLPPAAELDLSDDFGIRYDVVPGVRRQTKANYPSHEWRPDLGIPPLVDLDPQRLGVEALRGRVHKYLEETLTAAMSGDDQRAWREELTRLGAIARVVVVYPDASTESWFLELGRSVGPVAFRRGDGQAVPFVNLHTSIAASALVALEDGELSTFAALFGPYRGWRRLYRLSPSGLEPVLERDLDPVLRFLFRGGTERYLDTQLRRLGC